MFPLLDPKTLDPSLKSEEFEQLETTQSSQPEENVVIFPNVLNPWVDHKLQQRLTAVILLPLGCSKKSVSAKIECGGSQLIVVYKWSDVLLDPIVVNAAFTTPMGQFNYNKNHSKTVM